MKISLLNATTSGMKNLEETISIDFYNKKTIDSDFVLDGDRVRVIYGKNGSGKSAFMTSVWVAERMFNDPNFLSKCGVEMLSKLFNKNKRTFDISFVFVCQEDETKIAVGRYGFELRLDEMDAYIEKEYLDVLNGKRLSGTWSKVFEAEKGVLGTLNVPLSEELIGELKDNTRNLLSKTLFLKLFVRNMIQAGKRDEFFDLVEQNKSSFALEGAIEFGFSLNVYIDPSDKHLDWAKENRSKWSEISNQELEEIRTLLSTSTPADNSSVKVRADSLPAYRKLIEKQADFIRLFKPNLLKIELTDERKEGEYVWVRRVFVYDKYEVSFEFESTGVKKLSDLYLLLDEASSGGIVFIDELDANISGPYLREITSYFNIYGEGQLCFTAHSVDPMYALSDNKKAIYFLGDDNAVVPWTKNGHYKPYILYPAGMIKGSDFPVVSSDFISVFSGEGDD